MPTTRSVTATPSAAVPSAACPHAPDLLGPCHSPDRRHASDRTASSEREVPHQHQDPHQHHGPRRALAARLDDEWGCLRRSRRSLRRAASWRSATGDHPLDRVLDDLDDLDAIVRATHRDVNPPDVGDAIMTRLVQLARTDELACRLLVQRLLPGLTSRARTYRTFGQRSDLLDVVVPCACECILRYDVDRRPRHVAAALISDAVFHAFRQPLRRRAATEVVCTPARFVDTCADLEPGALETLATVVRDARDAGVSDDDLALIRELAADGSTTVVAARRGVTSRTIRNHRLRATTNIRLALDVAA